MTNRINSYKGARILQEGNYYYVQMGTNKVQISAQNALRIFMTCTSFCGDIQNRLYYLGDYYGVYPEHSEEYKMFIQKSSAELQTKINTKTHELEFGSIVQMLTTKEHMFYIGYICAMAFSDTKHIKEGKAPNSTRYHAFVDSKNNIHLIGARAKLNTYFIILPDGTASSMRNHFPNYESALIDMKEYAHQAEPKFFELCTNNKLDIVFVHDRKFKGQELECKKMLCSRTVRQLIDINMLSPTRHFINVQNKDINFKHPQLVDPAYYYLPVKTLEFYLS